MRLISQRHNNDCGVCCLAMLAGVQYSVAKRQLFGDGDIDITQSGEMKAALQGLGQMPGERLIPLRGRELDSINGAALVKTNLRKDGEWHWIVWTGKKVLDPKNPPYQRLRPVSYLPLS